MSRARAGLLGVVFSVVFGVLTSCSASATGTNTTLGTSGGGDPGSCVAAGTYAFTATPINGASCDESVFPELDRTLTVSVSGTTVLLSNDDIGSACRGALLASCELDASCTTTRPDGQARSVRVDVDSSLFFDRAGFFTGTTTFRYAAYRDASNLQRAACQRTYRLSGSKE